MHDGHTLFGITTTDSDSDRLPLPGDEPETVTITARGFTAPPGAADTLQFDLEIVGEAINITSCE